MLQELAVENLLLIERAQLRFAAGLNVITGETGAGKSVLAHALDLLLGGRARDGIVRPGAAEAYVEGIFDLPSEAREALAERLPADAQEIVLARRVGAEGRTRAYINGRSAPVGELRQAGETLLSFYGQHEHRRLTVAAAQLALLDELCGGEQALSLRACAETHARVRSLAERLVSLREMAESREREFALLEHELAEIEALAVEEGEHERLLASRERLRRAEALRQAAGSAEQALAADADEAPGALARLAQALAGLKAIAGSDASLDALAQRLSSLVIEGEDLAGELGAYREALAAEASAGEDSAAGAGALEAVEQRLAEIERLVRRHGGSPQGIAGHAAWARARRAELSGAELELAQVDEELERARAQLAEHADSLRERRRAMAPALARAVRERLAGLAMSEASFEVLLSEREVGPSGADAVEFRISPNPGVPAGPVREIASGGELSRIMLALNTACLDRGGSAGIAARGRRERGAKGTDTEPRPTLAFDELDAGIGGQTARAVGAQLRELARERQLLCITHLPQIASLGQRHFAIVKDTSFTPTKTVVVELGEGQVVSELVRMLGADANDSAARRHARELRKAA